MSAQANPPNAGRRMTQTMTPLPTLTTAQMAEVDRLMVEVYGIRLVQMMENAGRNLAEQARRMCGGSVIGRRVTVMCGAGNNGGGGMVAARHLRNWGAQAQVIAVGFEARPRPVGLKEVPALQWQTLVRMGAPGAAERAAPFKTPDIVLDAVIGYGLRGEPRGAAVEWIEWANAQDCPTLALDVPSGLNATTGRPASHCMRAAATLTLALPKTGLIAPSARAVVGDLYLADIGVPPELYRRLGLEIGPIFAEDSILRLTEVQYGHD